MVIHSVHELRRGDFKLSRMRHQRKQSLFHGRNRRFHARRFLSARFHIVEIRTDHAHKRTDRLAGGHCIAPEPFQTQRFRFGEFRAQFFHTRKILFRQNKSLLFFPEDAFAPRRGVFAQD